MLGRLLLFWIWLTWAAAADPWWVASLGMPADSDIQTAWNNRQPTLSQEVGESLTVSDLQLRKLHDPRISDPVQASAVVACLSVQCQQSPTTRYGFCRLNSMGKGWNFGSFQWTNPERVTRQGPFPVEPAFASAQERDDYLTHLFPGCRPGFPGQSSLPDWTLVVGAGALGAAAVTTIARRQLKSRQPQKKDPPRYALQLSSDSLQLASGQSAGLTITAWRIDLAAGPVAAPEAFISIQAPAGLQAQPAQGQGSLTCQVLLTGQQKPLPLQVTAVAGPARTSAQVQVTLTPPQLVLSAWVRGQASQDVVYRQGWDFAEITVYFHPPGQPDQPMDPGFAVHSGNTTLRADPPALELQEVFQQGPGQFSLRVNPLDLETYLGPDLADRDGLIQVSLKVSPGDGQTHTAAVGYRVRPQLEIILQGWPDPRQRFYRNLTLEGLELVTDGEDQLQLALACCRSDKPGTREIGLIQLVRPEWWTWEWKLQGEALAGFDWLPPQNLEEGGQLLTFLTPKPLLDAPERRSQELILHLQVQTSTRAPANYLNQPLRRDQPLKPRFLDLRCWLVPGLKRATSEAWCLLFLHGDSSQTLADSKLRLEIETRGTARLDPPINQARTGPDGSCQFVLTYTGLDWSNYDQAVFQLNFKVESPNQQESPPLKLCLEVAANLSRLLQDLMAAEGQLQLTNPCFGNGTYLQSLQTVSAAGLALLHLVPALRGPLWNVSIALSGHDTNQPQDRFYRLFVCSELRNRICKWLCSRRHYRAGSPDLISLVSSMNAIEFENYRLGFIHAWSGIFLSGMEPMQDPRGLDPWWEQHWRDEQYLDPNGLYSNERERRFLFRWRYWLTASGRGAQVVLRTMLAGLGISVAPGLDLISEILTRQLEGVELDTGPDYRYDPSVGYRYYQPEEGISESHALFGYLPRQRFLEDWREQHPNP
ncbi:MAG: hypothetical protein U0931_37150 [Vulcanimicrobiota bacterium]